MIAPVPGADQCPGGMLVSAAVAERSGISPLRMGAACRGRAISGLVGARIHHLLVFTPHDPRQRSWAALWDSTRGGWSVFGALLALALSLFLLACCVFNGCL